MDAAEELERFFQTPWLFYFDHEVSKLALILEANRMSSWSQVPKLYFILRGMGHLHLIPLFIEKGVSDESLPIDAQLLLSTLSDGLTTESAASFEELQRKIVPQPTSIYYSHLQPYLALDRNHKENPLDDIDFLQIGRLLELCGNSLGAKSPKLFYVLHTIGQTAALPTFHEHGFNDMWFPFPARTLRAPLIQERQMKTAFLNAQQRVCSRRWSEDVHMNFADDDYDFLTIQKKLGDGGTGEVTHVYCRSFHKHYARKLMDRRDLRFFANEVKMLKPTKHRRCVSLICSYTDPESFAILSRPVADMNLGTFLEARSIPLDRKLLLQSFFGCLSTTLAYLHSKGIRHKDIKPQNILIHGNNILFTDFGLSTSSIATTATSMMGNTPRYSSPEAADGLSRDESSDIWSLGCVFLEMLGALQQSTISDIKAYFRRTGSGRESFNANEEAVKSWMSDVRFEAELMYFFEASVVRSVTLEMLSHTKDLRPTSHLLMKRLGQAINKKGAEATYGKCCRSDLEAAAQETVLDLPSDKENDVRTDGIPLHQSLQRLDLDPEEIADPKMVEKQMEHHDDTIISPSRLQNRDESSADEVGPTMHRSETGVDYAISKKNEEKTQIQKARIFEKFSLHSLLPSLPSFPRSQPEAAGAPPKSGNDPSCTTVAYDGKTEGQLLHEEEIHHENENDSSLYFEAKDTIEGFVEQQGTDRSHAAEILPISHSHEGQYCIAVSNLKAKVNQSDLFTYFYKHFRNCTSVKLFSYSSSGRSRGWACVRFSDEEERLRAVRVLHGEFLREETSEIFKSKPVIVNKSNGQESPEIMDRPHPLSTAYNALKSSELDDYFDHLKARLSEILGEQRIEHLPINTFALTAVARYEFESGHPRHLNLRFNDRITHIAHTDKEWWWGKNLRGEEGFFPSHHVNQPFLALLGDTATSNQRLDLLEFSTLPAAASRKDWKFARDLVRGGAPINARDVKGRTAFLWAAKEGNSDEIEFLWTSGADHRVRTTSNATALHLAARNEDERTMEFLLSLPNNELAASDTYGWTPLHVAAAHDRVKILELLIDNGASIDAVTHGDRMPIHIAADRGCGKVLKSLLGRGALPSAVTRKEDMSPLHLGAQRGHLEIINMLLENDAGEFVDRHRRSPLHLAAEKNRLEVVRLLLGTGANIDRSMRHGMTCLHIAASYGHLELARLLLDKGANIHLKDRHGNTAFDIAGKDNHDQIAQLIGARM